LWRHLVINTKMEVRKRFFRIKIWTEIPGWWKKGWIGTICWLCSVCWPRLSPDMPKLNQSFWSENVWRALSWSHQTD
jgi:hypothetical protein